MALLPADIPTGRVVGQFAFLVQDGPDGDTKPDSGAVLGDVTFTCSAPIVRFPGKPLTAVPLTFTAEIVNDTLTAKGGSPASDGIELLATDSQLTNPTGFTWNVSFNLRRADNFAPISLPSFDIQVPTNGVVDLTSAMPVSSSNGVITTQGPKGDKGDQGLPGPAGASGSKQQAIDALIGAGYRGVTNLVTNPSAESGTAGWTASKATLSSDAAWSLNGTQSFRLTSATASDCDMRIGNATTVPLGLQGGKTYTLSATCRLAAAQTGTIDVRARRVIVLTSNDGASLVWNYGTQAPNAAGTFRSTVTFTVPANVTGVIVMLGAGAVGTDIWWDAVQLEEGATASTYVDGSMPNAYWSSTAGASASVGVSRSVTQTTLPGTVPPVYFTNNSGGQALLAYETGLRNIASTLPVNTYTAGTVTLQRSGNEVTLQWSDLSLTGSAAVAGTLDLPILPPGFRPPASNYQFNTVGATATPVRRLNVLATGTVRIYSFAPSDLLTGVFKWPTLETPPSTLPGV